MSYLARLKQHRQDNPAPAPQPTFVGFEGGPDSHVQPNTAARAPYEGYEGASPSHIGATSRSDRGYVFEEEEERSLLNHLVPSKKGGVGTAAGRQNPLPQAPSKPSKGSAADDPAPRGPRQTDTSSCWICGKRDAPDRPFIAILSGHPGQPYWMHSTCWPEHIRRCSP